MLQSLTVSSSDHHHPGLCERLQNLGDHRRHDQTNLPMQSCRQLQFPVTFISVFRVFCTFSGRMDTCTVHPINPTSNIDKLLWCLLVEVFFKRTLFFPQKGKISQNTIDPCPLQCNSKVMKCCENRFKLLKPLLKLPMFTSQFEKFQTASVKI